MIAYLIPIPRLIDKVNCTLYIRLGGFPEVVLEENQDDKVKCVYLHVSRNLMNPPYVLYLLTFLGFPIPGLVFSKYLDFERSKSI